MRSVTGKERVGGGERKRVGGGERKGVALRAGPGGLTLEPILGMPCSWSSRIIIPSVMPFTSTVLVSAPLWDVINGYVMLQVCRLGLFFPVEIFVCCSWKWIQGL